MTEQEFISELNELCDRRDGSSAYHALDGIELKPHQWQNYLASLAIGLTKREALLGATSANPVEFVSFRLVDQGGRV